MAVIYADKNMELTHTRTEVPEKKTFHLHMHDNYEILCPLSGDIGFIVEGSEYAAPSGCALLTRPMESHRLIVRSTEPYERYVLNFRGEVLEERGFGGELLAAFCSRELGKRNRYLASQLGGVSPALLFKRAEEACVGADGERKKQIILANLAAALCSLSVAFRGQGENSEVKTDSGVGASLLAFVNDNLSLGIGVEMAAEHIHMSVSQTERIFRRLTGTSLYEYVLSKRLYMARELIRDGAKAAEAAEKCGFCDYSSFYRQYKKRMGAPPSQARAMALDSEDG